MNKARRRFLGLGIISSILGLIGKSVKATNEKMSTELDCPGSEPHHLECFATPCGCGYRLRKYNQDRNNFVFQCPKCKVLFELVQVIRQIGFMPKLDRIVETSPSHVEQITFEWREVRGYSVT